MPKEIEEAAWVDGCTLTSAMLRIVVPLSRQGVLITAIFSFSLAMQEFLYAVVYVAPRAEKVDVCMAWASDEVLRAVRVLEPSLHAEAASSPQPVASFQKASVASLETSAKKPAGKTLYVAQYEVACNKVGESLGAKEKKNLCIVTGGLGTSTVSYKGQTFYVCCSGCRDAFNENPEKFIKEFEKKNKK